LGNHAVLRRELNWGDLGLVVFEDLGGVPRGAIEEGGQLVFQLGFGERFWVNKGFKLCVLLVNGVTDWTLRCTRGEGFSLGLCQGASYLVKYAIG
jgi:hypothetical protein